MNTSTDALIVRYSKPKILVLLLGSVLAFYFSWIAFFYRPSDKAPLTRRARDLVAMVHAYPLIPKIIGLLLFFISVQSLANTLLRLLHHGPYWIVDERGIENAFSSCGPIAWENLPEFPAISYYRRQPRYLKLTPSNPSYYYDLMPPWKRWIAKIFPAFPYSPFFLDVRLLDIDAVQLDARLSEYREIWENKRRNT